MARSLPNFASKRAFVVLSLVRGTCITRSERTREIHLYSHQHYSSRLDEVQPITKLRSIVLHANCTAVLEYCKPSISLTSVKWRHEAITQTVRVGAWNGIGNIIQASSWICFSTFRDKPSHFFFFTKRKPRPSTLPLHMPLSPCF